MIPSFMTKFYCHLKILHFVSPKKTQKTKKLFSPVLVNQRENREGEEGNSNLGRKKKMSQL